jgi:hypothetical protein
MAHFSSQLVRELMVYALCCDTDDNFAMSCSQPVRDLMALTSCSNADNDFVMPHISLCVIS